MVTRMTSQREIILAELKKNKQHLSADELYELVRKIMPRISLATVYRNLEFLAEAGMVARLEISGRQKRFDSELHEHDHVYCVQCHKIENVHLERKQEDSPSHAIADGYIITGHRLEFVGLCPLCQQKNRMKKETT